MRRVVFVLSLALSCAGFSALAADGASPDDSASRHVWTAQPPADASLTPAGAFTVLPDGDLVVDHRMTPRRSAVERLSPAGNLRWLINIAEPAGNSGLGGLRDDGAGRLFLENGLLRLTGDGRVLWRADNLLVRDKVAGRISYTIAAPASDGTVWAAGGWCSRNVCGGDPIIVARVNAAGSASAQWMSGRTDGVGLLVPLKDGGVIAAFTGVQAFGAPGRTALPERMVRLSADGRVGWTADWPPNAFLIGAFVRPDGRLLVATANRDNQVSLEWRSMTDGAVLERRDNVADTADFGADVVDLRLALFDRADDSLAVLTSVHWQRGQEGTHLRSWTYRLDNKTGKLERLAALPGLPGGGALPSPDRCTLYTLDGAELRATALPDCHAAPAVDTAGYSPELPNLDADWMACRTAPDRACVSALAFKLGRALPGRRGALYAAVQGSETWPATLDTLRHWDGRPASDPDEVAELANNNRFDEALAGARRLADPPERAEALATIGARLGANGFRTAAARAFADSMAVGATMPAARRGSVRAEDLLRSTGDFAAAQRMAESIRDDRERAYAYVRLANVSRLRGFPDQARSAIDAADKVASTMTAPSAILWETIGSEWTRNGLSEQALRAYRASVPLQPDFSDMGYPYERQLAVAHTLLDLGAQSDADAILDQVANTLATAPHTREAVYSPSWAGAAELALRLGRIDQAKMLAASISEERIRQGEQARIAKGPQPRPQPPQPAPPANDLEWQTAVLDLLARGQSAEAGTALLRIQDPFRRAQTIDDAGPHGAELQADLPDLLEKAAKRADSLDDEGRARRLADIAMIQRNQGDTDGARATAIRLTRKPRSQTAIAARLLARLDDWDGIAALAGGALDDAAVMALAEQLAVEGDATAALDAAHHIQDPGHRALALLAIACRLRDGA